MKLSVYSLKRTLFEGAAVSVNCPTEVGEITVLDNHRPLITILKTGTMKVVDAEGKEHYFPVKDGFVEVKTGNQVRCIVEESVDGS
jgi:F-type H+-transporting ATPase subunit epsilon